MVEHSNERSSELQYLMDRAAIQDLLVRYFQGLDRSSPERLRYLDRMRRQENGWRISDRIHTLDWSCQVPTNFAVTLAQRVSALPARL